MRSFIICLASIVGIAVPASAEAQVETAAAEEQTPAQPAPPPAPAPVPAEPADPTASRPQAAEAPSPAAESKTITFVLPDHRFELAARMGAIGGGEVTPSGLNRGHSQPSWTAGAGFDAITLPFNPFFTIGGYLQLTNTGYERFSGGAQINSEGSMTLVSIGPTVKARFQLAPGVAAKAGVTLGYNNISFSVIEDGKTIDASGSGMNLGFTGEMAFDVSRTVAISAQLSFVSQVAGSVTVEGRDRDLAMTPKPFLTVGPEFHF